MSRVQFRRVVFVLTLVVATASTAFAAGAAPLSKGLAFPLSDGAAPTLIGVEVDHVSSDNTLDVAVSLTPPTLLPKSQGELLAQLGELCLRYEATIVAGGVPAPDRNRINVFAPLYRFPVPGDSKKFIEQGFAFRILDGKCSLDAPFPANLKAATLQRSEQSVGGN
jgi:hypothetical protein